LSRSPQSQARPGTWKVSYLSAPQAGVSVEHGGKPLPSDEKAKALALDSLLEFNKAIQDKNFAGFYQQISKRWQEQIAPDKLKEIFTRRMKRRAPKKPVKRN
jgi:hypothetical protein